MIDEKSIDIIINQSVYDLKENEKKQKLLEVVQCVTRHHYEQCYPYKRLCDKRGFNPQKYFSFEELPYLPTSLFKDIQLLSIPSDKLFREIKSSATTTGQPSRVGLDKVTSRRQSKCFNRVVINRIGNERRKFIVLDKASSVGRTEKVSARDSTIRSLLFCASEVDTCLIEEEEKLRLDYNKLIKLLKDAEGNPQGVVIFGFTFILYAHVVKRLMESGNKFKLPGAKILHIGGWKKLESFKVSPEKLISDCCETFGVFNKDVVDFYGFTEQSGMIYPTCEEGVRHTPIWAEVIVRDPLTLKPVLNKQKGILQFITPIQTSYPGHSVLTEDIGFVNSVDDCNCGRKGTTFKVVGRSLNAEVRGCGDIMGDLFE